MAATSKTATKIIILLIRIHTNSWGSYLDTIGVLGTIRGLLLAQIQRN